MTILELRERAATRVRTERKVLVAKPVREPVDIDRLERELAEEFSVTFAELAK